MTWWQDAKVVVATRFSGSYTPKWVALWWSLVASYPLILWLWLSISSLLEFPPQLYCDESQMLSCVLHVLIALCIGQLLGAKSTNTQDISSFWIASRCKPLLLWGWACEAGQSSMDACLIMEYDSGEYWTEYATILTGYGPLPRIPNCATPKWTTSSSRNYLPWRSYSKSMQLLSCHHDDDYCWELRRMLRFLSSTRSKLVFGLWKNVCVLLSMEAMELISSPQELRKARWHW